MREWTPTPEELHVDWYRANVMSRNVEPVECNTRIAFHDDSQEAVKVITPAPRFIATLMAGGYVRHARVCREEAGRPVLEGTGEIMGPMSYDEAIEFLLWKDLPRGVNNYSIMTTDDLPRIRGDIDLARKFRNAWRLEQINE